MGCRVVTRAGRTGGAGHKNTLRPEWAEGHNARNMCILIGCNVYPSPSLLSNVITLLQSLLFSNSCLFNSTTCHSRDWIRYRQSKWMYVWTNTLYILLLILWLWNKELEVYRLNSLGHSDAIWRWGSWSTLVQVAWRHQAITWTNVDLSSARFCGIHLRTLS